MINKLRVTKRIDVQMTLYKQVAGGLSIIRLIAAPHHTMPNEAIALPATYTTSCNVTMLKS